MLDNLIRFALRQRMLVVILAALLAVGGVGAWSAL